MNGAITAINAVQHVISTTATKEEQRSLITRKK